MGRHNHIKRNKRKKDFREHYDVIQMYLPQYAACRYIVCDQLKMAIENVAAPRCIGTVMHMLPGPKWEQLMLLAD